MTVMAPDPQLAGAVVRHLDTQLASARRLLELVLSQGQAIRERDVEAVLLRLSEIKTEMALREQLEQERTLVIARAGAALGVAPAGVTLDALLSLMPSADAALASEHSAELRGLLGEIAREHGINRALMRQELAFLDHLVRLIGSEPATGYAPADTDAAAHRVLDLSA
jgi:hypothetical protein